MKKSRIILISSLFLALGCYVAYKMSPNYVAEDGMLVEAFWAIPLFYIFMLIAGVIGGRLFYRKFFNKD